MGCCLVQSVGICDAICVRHVCPVYEVCGILPSEGIFLVFKSAQFGRQIKAVITETLTGLGIDNAYVKATDKGALDCTIRARVTAAAVRATGKDVWKD